MANYSLIEIRYEKHYGIDCWIVYAHLPFNAGVERFSFMSEQAAKMKADQLLRKKDR